MWLARHIDQPNAIFLAFLHIGDRQSRIRASRVPTHTVDKDSRWIVRSRDIVCIDMIPETCQATGEVCTTPTHQSRSVITVEPRKTLGDIE